MQRQNSPTNLHSVRHGLMGRARGGLGLFQKVKFDESCGQIGVFHHACGELVAEWRHFAPG